MQEPIKSASFRLHIGPVEMQIRDVSTSTAALIVGSELHQDSYGLRNLRLAPGDVVLDIGGHIGMFAIFLAKLFPGVRIISYEPIPENAAHFAANLRLNGIGNVELVNRAVTADGRELEMLLHPGNTGGATASSNYVPHSRLDEFRHYRVPSVTLETVFATHGLERVNLLKIDCEGLEYEILLQTPLIDRFDAICGELHINRHLRAQGYSIEALQAHCARYLPPERLCFQPCQMSE